MVCCLAGQRINGTSTLNVEGQMVQPGTAALVPIGDERRRLFDDEVGRPEPPTSTVRPTLERRITQRLQQPADRSDSASQIGHPQLDMVQRAANRLPLTHANKANDAADKSVCRPGSAHAVTAPVGRRALTRRVPSAAYGKCPSVADFLWTHCGQ